MRVIEFIHLRLRNRIRGFALTRNEAKSCLLKMYQRLWKILSPLIHNKGHTPPSQHQQRSSHNFDADQQSKNLTLRIDQCCLLLSLLNNNETIFFD